jgi:hypothetical protein
MANEAGSLRHWHAADIEEAADVRFRCKKRTSQLESAWPLLPQSRRCATLFGNEPINDRGGFVHPLDCSILIE